MSQSQIVRVKADAQVRTVNDETRTVTVVASTFARDSYNTRIDPNGWDLTQFATRNPSILWAHDDRGMIAQSAGLPVGKGIGSTVRSQDGKLVMDIQFTADDENPFGYRVYKLVKGGYLNMVSVGFDPMEWEDVEENGQIVRIYRKQKLVELSVVAIGANDEALFQRSAVLNHTPEEARALVSDVENMERMIRSIGKVLIGDDHEMYKGYFERKQPANKAATSFLKKFYEARNEEIPQEEVVAWTKAETLIEVKEGEPVTETTTTTVETKEPTPQPTPAPAAPEPAPVQAAPERTVQIPLTVLSAFPATLARNYVDAAVAALRQGIPLKEVGTLIDGLNQAAVHSLSTQLHGSNS